MKHKLFKLWSFIFYTTKLYKKYKYKACLYSLFSGLKSVYQPCYYDRELIPRGTSVTRNCMSCYCGTNRVVSCCSWVTISLSHRTNRGIRGKTTSYGGQNMTSAITEVDVSFEMSLSIFRIFTIHAFSSRLY